MSPSSAIAEQPESRATGSHTSLAARIYRIRYSLAAFIVLSVLVCLFGYYQFTLVSGLEINTRTWQVRKFSFRRDPLTNYQLTGLLHEPAPKYLQLWTAMTNASAVDATIGAYLDPQIPVRWDLVSISTSPTPGPARSLIDVLETVDRKNTPFWPKWSRDHSQQASLFWPAIQDLVDLSLYEYIPDACELAVTKNKDTPFKRRLDEYMLETLQQAAILARDQQHSDDALAIAKIGLEYGRTPLLESISASVQAETEDMDDEDDLF